MQNRNEEVRALVSNLSEQLGKSRTKEILRVFTDPENRFPADLCMKLLEQSTRDADDPKIQQAVITFALQRLDYLTKHRKDGFVEQSMELYLSLIKDDVDQRILQAALHDVITTNPILLAAREPLAPRQAQSAQVAPATLGADAMRESLTRISEETAARKFAEEVSTINQLFDAKHSYPADLILKLLQSASEAANYGPSTQEKTIAFILQRFSTETKPSKLDDVNQDELDEDQLKKLYEKLAKKEFMNQALPAFMQLLQSEVDSKILQSALAKIRTDNPVILAAKVTKSSSSLVATALAPASPAKTDTLSIPSVADPLSGVSAAPTVSASPEGLHPNSKDKQQVVESQISQQVEVAPKQIKAKH